jgi:hypothetical protein
MSPLDHHLRNLPSFLFHPSVSGGEVGEALDAIRKLRENAKDYIVEVERANNYVKRLLP